MNDLMITGNHPLAVVRSAMESADYYHEQIDMIRNEPRLEVMPTPAERKAIEEGAKALYAFIRPIGTAIAAQERAREAFGALYTGYARLPDTADNLVTACVLHLEKIPLFAIIEAIGEIRSGSARCDDLGIKAGWPPGAFQVFQLAEQIVEPYSARWGRMRKVLAAKQVTYRVPEAEREKVSHLLADLANALRAPLSAEELARKRRAAEYQRKGNRDFMLREYAERGIEPFKDADGELVSFAMCERIGMVIGEDDETGRRFMVMPKAPQESADERTQALQT